jgi:hypothetical protein
VSQPAFLSPISLLQTPTRPQLLPGDFFSTNRCDLTMPLFQGHSLRDRYLFLDVAREASTLCPHFALTFVAPLAVSHQATFPHPHIHTHTSSLARKHTSFIHHHFGTCHHLLPHAVVIMFWRILPPSAIQWDSSGNNDPNSYFFQMYECVCDQFQPIRELLSTGGKNDLVRYGHVIQKRPVLSLWFY